jgi:cytochrome c oxidase subunit IV
MEFVHLVPGHSHATHESPEKHDTMREGIRLGLTIGVITWVWLAAFDFVSGEPFQTVQYLGGFAKFTLIHFALCLGYGLTIIGAVHASMKEPTLMFAIIFCTILFQAAFVMLSALLANVGLGRPAWGKFLLGNVIAAGVTYALISRRHPMRDLYHAAEAHQKD